MGCDIVLELGFGRQLWVDRRHVGREAYGQGAGSVPASAGACPGDREGRRRAGRGDFDEEGEILKQWGAALDVFEKVLESSSDKATRPDFEKEVVEFFKDKIMGELAKRAEIHGTSEAIDLLKKLEDEMKRAEAAKGSTDRRDFMSSTRGRWPISRKP